MANHDYPGAPEGLTPFQQAVYTILAATEPGDVLSYGEVAAEAGYPGAARAVGNALRTIGATRGAQDVELPWWRVVTADGRLIPHDPERQASLLQQDGVEVPLRPQPRL